MDASGRQACTCLHQFGRHEVPEVAGDIRPCKDCPCTDYVPDPFDIP